MHRIPRTEVSVDRLDLGRFDQRLRVVERHAGRACDVGNAEDFGRRRRRHPHGSGEEAWAKALPRPRRCRKRLPSDFRPIFTTSVAGSAVGL
jgi:hypothetical protein